MLSELVVNELQELQEEHKGYKVTDLESANWCLRKKAAIAQQRKEYFELAEREIARIHGWLNSELDKLNGQEDFFDGLLYEYAIEQRKLNPKFKLSTPYGKVSFRKQQPKWNYDDEAVLNWAKQNERQDLIRVKEELDKKQLKWYAQQQGNYAVTVDGEIIPGISIEEQEEAIKIEVSE